MCIGWGKHKRCELFNKFSLLLLIVCFYLISESFYPFLNQANIVVLAGKGKVMHFNRTAQLSKVQVYSQD